jgi:hypothetical protein
VKVCPPIVTVPVRAVPVLRAAVTVTVPFPLPVAPAVMLSQAALLVAVHAHEPDADTATLTFAPAAGTDWLVGLIVTVHGADVPA